MDILIMSIVEFLLQSALMLFSIYMLIDAIKEGKRLDVESERMGIN